MASTQSQINKMYDNQLNTELSALKRSQQQATNRINQQKKETSQDYYDKRNQSDVVNFQNQKRLRELMASSGLGRSGENISGQVGLSAARQQALSGLNRDEQNILGKLNTEITEINDPSHANEIRSRIEALRSQTLLEALERKRDRAAQRARERALAQPKVIENVDPYEEIYRDAIHALDVKDREKHKGVLRPFLGTDAYYNKMGRVFKGLV